MMMAHIVAIFLINKIFAYTAGIGADEPLSISSHDGLLVVRACLCCFLDLGLLLLLLFFIEVLGSLHDCNLSLLLSTNRGLDSR